MRGVFMVQTDMTPHMDGTAWQDERKTCVERLREKLRIVVVKRDEEEMVFDLIGANASLANALRRILIAEVCARVCVGLAWLIAMRSVGYSVQRCVRVCVWAVCGKLRLLDMVDRRPLCVTNPLICMYSCCCLAS